MPGRGIAFVWVGIHNKAEVYCFLYIVTKETQGVITALGKIAFDGCRHKRIQEQTKHVRGKRIILGEFVADAVPGFKVSVRENSSFGDGRVPRVAGIAGVTWVTWVNGSVQQHKAVQ